MDHLDQRNPRLCHALISDRSRLCERFQMYGQAVCYSHGGASPQAKRKAKERIAQAVIPVITDATKRAIRANLSGAERMYLYRALCSARTMGPR